ncbi:transcriptional regulator [Ramlibacter sp. PS3R-8]|uniref:transcriptional regulator n=1 Tax=Ramlibacter sp. PS3R-8 TaxID=3133437 RepID=UPI00309CF5B2
MPAPDGLALRLLGPLEVRLGGAPVELPPSRKVRALLAYLALVGRPVSRSHLCELLWDLPSDPRGELRWALSKLRTLLERSGQAAVVAAGETIALQLPDGCVDARTVASALQEGIPTLSLDRLQALAGLLEAGDLLEGLDLPRSPVFTGWLVAERRRFRSAHAAVLEHCVRLLPAQSDRLLPTLERWLAVAPFDRQAHERMLQALAARGRLREGEEHLAAAARQYEAQGQDWAPIGHAWRAAKARHAAGALQAIAVAAAPESDVPSLPADGRASLAVMPFTDRTPGAALRGGVGDGMAHDIITRLAKLRSMFVIAEGTMFALSERRVGSEDAGRRLAVDYVASGSLRRTADAHLHVSVQLAETRGSRIVWADEFSGRLDETFAVLDDIGNRIVTAIALQVEVAERNRAILKNPNSLNAWEAHHRGLWHMVRFDRDDNEQARQFFQAAVRLDPAFARPHAGLSFTHWQDAFQGWRDAAPAIEQAYRAASEGLMADESDPSSHWSLGRAMWLKDRPDDALRELQYAVDLSPNFALGHYTIAFVHAQTGDPEIAVAEADHARALSPMDPLLFGMLASRALALVRLGRYEEAADSAVRAAARPNAHVHIQAIALLCLALAGKTAAAREMSIALRRARPGYGVDDLLKAFKVGPELQALTRKAARIVDA